MKPFRFGVNLRSAGSRVEWVDKARKLEDLGYSSLTVPDHLAEMFAPMPALVSAAAATKTIRVGTAVLNNDFRHPVLVAREAATVDLLTDGRLELGLGAGHVKSEYEQSGLRFDLGGARVERLAEAAVIIKRSDAPLDTVERRGDPSEPLRARRNRGRTRRRSPGAPDAVGPFLLRNSRAIRGRLSARRRQASRQVGTCRMATGWVLHR